MQLSRLQRIYRLRHLTLGVVGSSHLSNGNQLVKSDRVYFFSRNSEERWTALLSQHGFRLRGVQS